MRRFRFPALAVACAAGMLAPPVWVSACPDEKAGCCDEHDGRAVVQLAILLDTSGSMEGLIHQARTRIWAIVNELSRAKAGGKPVKLEVALYQYGADSLPSSEGFVSLLLPFTTDLDAISEKLFALKAEGSSEYCGWVLDSAVSQLTWTDGAAKTSKGASESARPLRIIVIAGNEPFTQGPKDYRSAITNAKEKGIVVNTIYCGPYNEGESSGWLNAAHLAGGTYNAIDHNVAIRYVPCPQDEQILKLNEQLNATYIPYGERGRELHARQQVQDVANREASPEAALQRAAAKSSHNYVNAQWDLLDACGQGRISIDAIETASLPPELQRMGRDELRRHIESLQQRRADIQRQIQTLTAEREKLRAEQVAAAGSETLDTAIRRDVREYARERGYSFE